MSAMHVEARLLRGRGRRLSRSRLEQIDGAGLAPEELASVLVWLVLEAVQVEAAELKAAVRRAMLILAAGGDPHRELALGDVAVERLAVELDRPERRVALTAALGGLAGEAAGLSTAAAMLAALQEDPDLAWRTYALALLADELADDDR
jgi:hypothetical protein